MSEFIVNPLYSRYRSFVESIAEDFSTNGEMIYNKRNVVKSFDEDGMRLVVKRYKVPLFVQRVAYTWFRPSKAKRAYVFGLRLQELGINTPEPVGCVEKKRCGLFRQGYFISTYTEHDSLKHHRDELLAEPIFFDSYVRFLIEMHEKSESKVLVSTALLKVILTVVSCEKPAGYSSTDFGVMAATFGRI